ncbi:MAG TPA: hypothetical protein H9909_07585 [Candidatus Mediterraneibacter norfolkensis]|nr:hypothetical protein [Candidatus Mediterraneibacter norfolkensis]
MYKFNRAKAVWGTDLGNKYNQFLGFYSEITLNHETEIKIAIAARSYYRLYLNGEIAASGPARTAKHYCRVDEITRTVSGTVRVAVEAVAYDKPGMYCNDCTLEPGILAVEIMDEEENVLSATGDPKWKYTELKYRRPDVETMSHSRGIVEVYDLEPDSLDWRIGQSDKWKSPVETKEMITWLERRAPYASYNRIPVNTLTDLADLRPVEGEGPGYVLTLAREFNPDWYRTLPQNNLFLESLRNEKEAPFTGRSYFKAGEITLIPGRFPAALTFCLEKSELGFIELTVNAERECTVDLINSDHRNMAGILKSNSYVTRYNLKAGSYHLVTFEPKLVRYIKVILRTEGKVTLKYPNMVDYGYPDDHSCHFECSDGDLNRIYEGAKRTQRLNTLDIFMDCPQRERGGWLCDSYFTAHGAAMLFGDHEVEKDFIENFMLTDPDIMWHSFFPEVYPGSKPDESDPGFQNWSLWLLAELAEYYKRTGDRDLIEACRTRVTRFIEGLLELRGESGLLEGMTKHFIDWSLSNRDFCVLPISVPDNCLAVYVPEKMANLYGMKQWRETARQMRTIIEEMDDERGIFGGGGDAAEYKDGKLSRKDCTTESGIALELKCSFHRSDRMYLQRFVHAMGTCPEFRADPNVGKANQFIGLMIRFDVLRELGETETLVKELKDLYLPELRDGSGTFFENYNALSGCHGFNGAAGALLMTEVLGLGEPRCGEKRITICPHPGKLRWAYGSVKCGKDRIFMNWSADHDAHVLDIRLQIPEDWNYNLKIPFELSGWKVILNGEGVSHGYLELED